MVLLLVLSAGRVARVLHQAYLDRALLMVEVAAAVLHLRVLVARVVLAAVVLVLTLHLLPQELRTRVVVEAVQEIIPAQAALAVQA